MGKILEKGAAAAGAGLVDEDVGDDTVAEPDGFHILPADVEDKVGVGNVVAAGLGVGDGLDGAVVGAEGAGHHFGAVARGAEAKGMQLHAALLPAAVEVVQLVAHHRERVAVVVAITAVEEVQLAVEDDGLAGGAAAVDAEPYRHLSLSFQHNGLRAAIGSKLGAVAGEEGGFLFFGGEEGIASFTR